MSRYSYALEKLILVEQSLIYGAGDMRSRLLSAYSNFHTLRVEDLPLEMQEDFERIKSVLTRKEPHGLSDRQIIIGSVEMSLKSMRNKTAVKIARKLMTMKRNLKHKIID